MHQLWLRSLHPASAHAAAEPVWKVPAAPWPPLRSQRPAGGTARGSTVQRNTDEAAPEETPHLNFTANVFTQQSPPSQRGYHGSLGSSKLSFTLSAITPSILQLLLT